ncbi:MAG: insulinase family protein [candidate division KSB1 bacterium]|nr:insulinase family protein [candidate division KSB1 bacterium]
MRSKKTAGSILLLVLMTLVLLDGITQAQSFEAIKSQIKEHTLANGMKFIVLERPEAPVVSFHTYADVGSAQEVYGITGISHLLEHMAFKGSKVVGTKDYAAEARLLEQVDQLYDQLTQAQNAIKPDSARIKALQAKFDSTNKAAHELVAVDEYFDMMMKQGGRGLNAYTSNDATQYITSLPSNRLEFWMAMESDRFMNPVFREFFEERNVVMEERRLGIETQPTGKLIEDFFAVAFKAHPYHHEVIGHMSDLRHITRKDVEEYFRKYYSPSNLTVAIVGDVNVNEVFQLAETYFSRIPSGPRPEPLRTEEPEQWGERRVSVEAQSQPILVVGYHRPSVRSQEDVSFDAMANVLGQGRSSRLYKSLVKEKKIAVQVGAMNGWPGDKYPNLFAAYAFPAKDHTSAECLEAIDAEIARLKTEPITAEELTKFKRQTRKSLIDRMKPNSQMAALLTYYDVVLGDWRKLFEVFKEVEAVTATDIQAVAQKYLIKKNRTVGEIVPEKP